MVFDKSSAEKVWTKAKKFNLCSGTSGNVDTRKHRHQIFAVVLWSLFYFLTSRQNDRETKCVCLGVRGSNPRVLLSQTHVDQGPAPTPTLDDDLELQHVHRRDLELQRGLP